MQKHKVTQGTKGTGRKDFVLEFGNFQLKKYQDTKKNREKAQVIGTDYWLKDKKQIPGKDRVSGAYILGNENNFVYDIQGKEFYKFTNNNGAGVVEDITEQEFKDLKKQSKALRGF